MRSSFEDRLSRAYPGLFPTTGRAGVDAKIVRIRCGEGWFLIIDMLCGQIQDLIESEKLPQATIHGIDEKFGMMRVSSQGSSDSIRALIRDAEQSSCGFCEVCGALGRMLRTDHGWIKTLCANCNVAASDE